MKYLPLVWAGLWRKRARTVLTVLSIVAAFVLFGALHGVTAGIDAIVERMSDSRLRIMSRVSIMEPLPLAHLSRIESVPGVTAVSYYNFFGGYYQEPANSVGAGAVDVERLLATTPEIEIAPAHVEAMRRTRNGALIGEDLAAERNWKIGDQVPLRSFIYDRKDGAEQWLLQIVGTYASSAFPSEELWMNYDYFDEARAPTMRSTNGTVTFYFAALGDASRAAEVSEAIDRQFANSMYETQSQTEKDFIRAQIAQIGNMSFFVNAIIGAVMFTLLILTGNTMMQSVRERIPELAVLKTYGFSDAAVVGLVFTESLLLCGVAAAVGLGIAYASGPAIFDAIGAEGLTLPWPVVPAGLSLAGLLAAVSALAPAWRVRKQSVVEALAAR